MTRNKQRNEQIRAESLAKLLATGRKLFAEKGYANCSVSDIARQAGMSQGIIYWYFSSKEELYNAILAEGFTTLAEIMAGAAVSPGTGVEKLDQFLDRFMAFMKAEGGDEFLSVVLNFMSMKSKIHFSEDDLSTDQVGARYHQSLNAVFQQGQAEGCFQQEVTADLLSTFLFSFINGLMLMYPEEWKLIPIQYFKEAVFRLVGAKQ